MSKFLLNLLVQISKALVNSKIQFLIQKFLFFAFVLADLAAHSAFGPAGSRCPCRTKPPSLAHPARASVASLWEYVFPFGSRLLSWSLLPRLSIKRAPTVSSVPHLRPPELGRTATASRPPRAAQLRASGATETLPPRHHFSPLNSPLKPPIFNGVKAINAGVNPGHPSPALSWPYKNHPDDPQSTSHLTEPFSSPLPRRNPSPLSSRDLFAPPPSPGRHATARAPVRPELHSPCSSLSFAPPPVSFGAPERSEAVLR
jgi:hypothetical protein